MHTHLAPRPRQARAFLWEHFALPAEVEIEQEWTGIIGWSCDDTPWVGAVPGQPGAYVCAGFCGSGLSRAFVCGMAVADMACGVPPRVFVSKYRPDLARGWTADLKAGHAVSEGAKQIGGSR